MSEHFRRLERMYHGAAINAIYTPTLRVSDGAAELTMPVRPEHFHAAHALHGSVYFKALDDAAFFAASSAVEGVFVLTVTFNIVMLRPVTEGTLRAVGSLKHRTRKLLVADAELFDHRDRVVARGSGTFMPSTIVLGPEVGYH